MKYTQQRLQPLAEATEDELMNIIIDTREKKISHITKWFDENNIGYSFKKLDEGDYQLEDFNGITIDRKKDLNEMCSCLSSERGRFMREVKRCAKNKEKLIVLIEQGGSYKGIEDVKNWKNKYGYITPQELRERLYRLHIGYGVEIIFCDKRTTARRIKELLNGENRQG